MGRCRQLGFVGFDGCVGWWRCGDVDGEEVLVPPNVLPELFVIFEKTVIAILVPESRESALAAKASSTDEESDDTND